MTDGLNHASDGVSLPARCLSRSARRAGFRGRSAPAVLFSRRERLLKICAAYACRDSADLVMAPRRLHAESHSALSEARKEVQLLTQ